MLGPLFIPGNTAVRHREAFCWYSFQAEKKIKIRRHVLTRNIHVNGERLGMVFAVLRDHFSMRLQKSNSTNSYSLHGQ